MLGYQNLVQIGSGHLNYLQVPIYKWCWVYRNLKWHKTWPKKTYSQTRDEHETWQRCQKIKK